MNTKKANQFPLNGKMHPGIGLIGLPYTLLEKKLRMTSIKRSLTPLTCYTPTPMPVNQEV